MGSRQPRYALTVSDGVNVRRMAIPPEGVTIGRDPTECNLVFDHTLISRVHCFIGHDDRGPRHATARWHRGVHVLNNSIQ